jgi:hypothetical protein
VDSVGVEEQLELKESIMTSGGTQPQTQTTTQVLSPEQRELMGLAMPGVTKYAAQSPERYQGSTIAGFDPSQVAGQEGALQSAGTQTELARSGAGTTAGWLGPNALDITQQPGLQGNIAAATRPITQALTEQALPAIRASAEQSGNFGSSRQGIAEGLASGRASQAIGDATSGIVSKAYDTNVNAQLKALGLLPSTIGTQTAGDLTTSGVGDVRQGMAQNLLGEQVGNFNFEQMKDYLQSKDIMSLLSGMPGGSTQSTASLPQKNQLTGALGGAAAGASLGTAIMPGIGTGAGAGLGALMSFLG